MVENYNVNIENDLRSAGNAAVFPYASMRYKNTFVNYAMVVICACMEKKQEDVKIVEEEIYVNTVFQNIFVKNVKAAPFVSIKK